MIQWVIYFNPKDYPGKYVARQWLIPEGGSEPIPARLCFVSESIDSARRAVPDGYFNIGRFPDDDPCIIEVWI